MKTLEVADLVFKSGGTLRAANIIAVRRTSGVKDCRTLPIIPPQATIDPRTVVTSCPSVGFAHLPSLIQRALLPIRWKDILSVLSPAKIMYKLLVP